MQRNGPGAMVGGRRDLAPRGTRLTGMVDLRETLLRCLLSFFLLLPEQFSSPSSPSLPIPLPPMGLSFNKNCFGRVTPPDAQETYENWTSDELHRLCSQRRYARQDTGAASETR